MIVQNHSPGRAFLTHKIKGYSVNLFCQVFERYTNPKLIFVLSTNKGNIRTINKAQQGSRGHGNYKISNNININSIELGL